MCSLSVHSKTTLDIVGSFGAHVANSMLQLGSTFYQFDVLVCNIASGNPIRVLTNPVAEERGRVNEGEYIAEGSGLRRGEG